MNRSLVHCTTNLKSGAPALTRQLTEMLNRELKAEDQSHFQWYQTDTNCTSPHTLEQNWFKQRVTRQIFTTLPITHPPHTLTSPHPPQHTCHLTSFGGGWLTQSWNVWVVGSASTESVWTLTPVGKQDVRLQNAHVNNQHGVKNCMGSFYLVSITLAVALLTEVLQEAD